MGDFWALYRGRGCVTEELQQRLKERDETAQAEREVTVDLQRIFRGKVARDRWKLMNQAVTIIARLYRGFRGRGVASSALECKLDREAEGVLHYHAIKIQGIYHGYSSRKYNYNHARRKQYLKEVADAGSAMRKTLRDHLTALEEAEEQEAREKRGSEIQRLSASLHHLVSTASIPGVFNSPYLQGAVPTIDGVAVDKHLTTNIRDLLKAKGYTKRGMEVDLNGTKRITLPEPASRLSLQASAPYDAEGQALAVTKAIHRLKMVGPREFKAGSKVPPPRYTRGVSEGTEYMESWKNPYLIRGVATQEELKLPFGQTSLGKHKGRPFYTSVGGNKSTVLPNDRFDVILEAEHKGISVLFPTPPTDERDRAQLGRERVSQQRSKGSAEDATREDDIDDIMLSAGVEIEVDEAASGSIIEGNGMELVQVQPQQIVA
ncbi:unnamed protein product [Chrysoparadoxa australica]